MDYCPVCLKNDIRNKIRAFQINLEEAVWACEGKECIWPFGYCELTFSKRITLYNELEDKTDLPIKENVPVSMELSLYTPPMTPLGQSSEFTISLPTEDKLGEASKNESAILRRDFAVSYTLPSLELQEVGINNSTKKDRSVTDKTCVSVCRTLPKIVDICETSVDITPTCRGTDKDANNRKMKDHKDTFANTSTVIESTKEFMIPFVDTLCEQFNLDRQCESTGSNSNNVRSNGTANDLETNCIKDILSETIKSECSMDNTNYINAINNSMLDISDSDINLDVMFDVLSEEDCITENINDEWLDMFQM